MADPFDLAEGEWRLIEYPFASQTLAVMIGVEVEEGEKGLRILYPNGSGHPPSFVALRRTIGEILDQRFGFARSGAYRMMEVVLPRGHVYPRVWRNGPRAEFERIGVTPEMIAIHEAERSAAFALRRLMRDLDDVFDVVEPSPASLGVHGHLLRDLLLRACTEVEAAWKGILRANGRKSDGTSTRDYVTLLGPMKLDEWKVRWTHFDIEHQPFLGWSSTAPTTTLRWYDDYNAVKHDREAAFARASLRSVMDAIAAVYVLFSAQFGPGFASGTTADLAVVQEPRWTSQEIYFPGPLTYVPLPG